MWELMCLGDGWKISKRCFEIVRCVDVCEKLRGVEREVGCYGDVFRPEVLKEIEQPELLALELIRDR